MDPATSATFITGYFRIPPLHHLKKTLAALAALALSLMPWTCRGRTTWSNHVPVSPGSNFVDLRKGGGPVL